MCCVYVTDTKQTDWIFAHYTHTAYIQKLLCDTKLFIRFYFNNTAHRREKKKNQIDNNRLIKFNLWHNLLLFLLLLQNCRNKMIANKIIKNGIVEGKPPIYWQPIQMNFFLHSFHSLYFASVFIIVSAFIYGECARTLGNM